jgi:hypothetical protein
MTADSILAVGVGESTASPILSAVYAQSTALQSSCSSLMEDYLIHINTSNFSPWRNRKDSQIGTLHVVTDSDKISYFAVVKAGYPDFLVNSLLDEVKAVHKRHPTAEPSSEDQGDPAAEGLVDDLCKLVDRYSNKLGSDRLKPLEITMYKDQENKAGQILQVLPKTSTETSEGRSLNSQVTAQMFHSGARKFERNLYWRKVKLIIIVVTYVFAIFLYVIIPLSMGYHE